MSVKISKLIRHLLSVPAGRIGLYLHAGVILICIIFRSCPDMLFDFAIRLDGYLAAFFHLSGGKLWDFGFTGLTFIVAGMVGAGFLSYGIAVRSLFVKDKECPTNQSPELCR